MTIRLFPAIAVLILAFCQSGLGNTSRGITQGPLGLSSAGDWGDGRADAADLPVAIDSSVVQWQTPMHGKAWSSPVVWGDPIWLTADGKQLSVVCVDRLSGTVLYDRVVIENESPHDCDPANSYASSTPALVGARQHCKRR